MLPVSMGVVYPKKRRTERDRAHSGLLEAHCSLRRLDDGVQPGNVAAPGEYADPLFGHVGLLIQHDSYHESGRPQIAELLYRSTAAAANRIPPNRWDSGGRCPQFLSSPGARPPEFGTAAPANMH